MIIDSEMSIDEALVGTSDDCDRRILKSLEIVSVKYFSYDEEIHMGQIVIHKKLALDIEAIFALGLQLKFPIQSAIPLASKQLLDDGEWSDKLSMQLNNSSGFFHRCIAGTNRLSNHSFGVAVDINPMQNPFVRGELVLPTSGSYDPSSPGTFTATHPITTLFKELGWTWGGEWHSLKDYHHFEKPSVIPDDIMKAVAHE